MMRLLARSGTTIQYTTKRRNRQKNRKFGDFRRDAGAMPLKRLDFLFGEAGTAGDDVQWDAVIPQSLGHFARFGSGAFGFAAKFGAGEPAIDLFLRHHLRLLEN
jgi:hypothetical protein